MLARSGRISVTELCKQYGISRKTGYKHLRFDPSPISPDRTFPFRSGSASAGFDRRFPINAFGCFLVGGALSPPGGRMGGGKGVIRLSLQGGLSLAQPRVCPRLSGKGGDPFVLPVGRDGRRLSRAMLMIIG